MKLFDHKIRTTELEAYQQTSFTYHIFNLYKFIFSLYFHTLKEWYRIFFLPKMKGFLFCFTFLFYFSIFSFPLFSLEISPFSL